MSPRRLQSDACQELTICRLVAAHGDMALAQ